MLHTALYGGAVPGEFRADCIANMAQCGKGFPMVAREKIALLLRTAPCGRVRVYTHNSWLAPVMNLTILRQPVGASVVYTYRLIRQKLQFPQSTRELLYAVL